MVIIMDFYAHIHVHVHVGQHHQQQDTSEGSSNWHTIIKGTGQQHKTLPSLQQLASGVLEMIKTTSPVAMESSIGEQSCINYHLSTYIHVRLV